MAENSSYARGLSAKEWHHKDINQCILTGDPECKFVEGEMRDRSSSFDQHDLAVVSNSIDCLLKFPREQPIDIFCQICRYR